MKPTQVLFLIIVYWIGACHSQTEFPFFSVHVIDSIGNRLGQTDLADMDNDGDLDGDGDADIVTGRAWYENLDGKGLRWKEHQTIDFGEKHKYGIALKTWVLDVDGDGDVDICTKPWSTGNVHYYLENRLIPERMANENDK